MVRKTQDRDINLCNGQEEKRGSERREKENLEQKFQALEEVIEKLEGEDVTLEQSFDLYNKGMTLLKNCTRMIDEVEKKVLVLDENGETHEF